MNSVSEKVGLEQQRAGSISAGFVLRAVLGLSVALLLAGTGWAATRDTTKARETELRQVRERIDSVRKSIQADAERRDSLVGELKRADESIQSARGELAEVRTRRQATEQQLQALQAEQSLAETRMRLEREALTRELRLSYMNGRNEQLKLLLNQQDPAQLGRMLNYYGYFGRVRAEHIQSINEQLAHIQLLQERIAAETAQLRSIESAGERSAKALAQARQKRANTLTQVETKLKSGTVRLDKLQSDAKSLERLLAELRLAMERAAAQAREQAREQANKSSSKAAQSVPAAAPKGRGSWPWPVSGNVLARFGQLRSGGPLKWEGLMIGSSTGAPVRAPAAGRVLYSDWLPGLGLLLVLDHGGGIMSLYGHNEQLYKKVGEQVERGEVLAAVGDTGLNGRSGLYLEIRNGKNPVDPLNWLGKP
jgi:septal ring factor EnvC (AmiA/AmiB activator)